MQKFPMLMLPLVSKAPRLSKSFIFFGKMCVKLVKHVLWSFLFSKNNVTHKCLLIIHSRACYYIMTTFKIIMKLLLVQYSNMLTMYRHIHPYTQTCMSSKLSQFSHIKWKKDYFIFFPSHTQVCNLPIWSCITSFINNIN